MKILHTTYHDSEFHAFRQSSGIHYISKINKQISLDTELTKLTKQKHSIKHYYVRKTSLCCSCFSICDKIFKFKKFKRMLQYFLLPPASILPYLTSDCFTVAPWNWDQKLFHRWTGEYFNLTRICICQSGWNCNTNEMWKYLPSLIFKRNSNLDIMVFFLSDKSTIT